ncbi:MAG TPA: hypothetical protein VIR59_09860 [Gaiellaceae bacterium]
MASEETETEGRQENGHDARRTVVRAAAIAAASGATALAAKKALSSSQESSSDDDEDDGGEGEQRQNRRQKDSGGGSSTMASMAGSAWSSASKTLMPMIEDAAGQAGEYLAKNGPDIVRENIVPQFIRGFENARESSEDE